MHPGKLAAARAALQQIGNERLLGIGSGSTVDIFIDELAKHPDMIDGAVASSEATARRLEVHGIEVLDLNVTGTLGLYIDGADEVDPALAMTQGWRGGADTRRRSSLQPVGASSASSTTPSLWMCSVHFRCRSR